MQKIPFVNIDKKGDRFEKMVALGIWLGLAALAVIFYIPAPARNSILPKCYFHSFTGLHCPGCGSTRAVHSLFQGHFIQAIDYNIFVCIFLPFALYALIGFTLRAWTGIRLPTRVLSARMTYIILTLILTFGILRNLPWYPFNILAP